MQRRSFVLAIAALCAVALAGGHVTPAKAEDATVRIDNFAFSPASITVAPGTTIIWENRDDIPHTVTEASGPPIFRSSALDTGDKYSRVFGILGTYHYFCSLHPHMQGTVVVE